MATSRRGKDKSRATKLLGVSVALCAVFVWADRASAGGVTLSVPIPRVNVPKVNVPTATVIPRVNVPKVNVPTVTVIPRVNVPKVNVPTATVIPRVNVPKANVPTATVIPRVNVPKVNVPTVSFSKVNTLNLNASNASKVNAPPGPKLSSAPPPGNPFQGTPLSPGTPSKVGAPLRLKHTLELKQIHRPELNVNGVAGPPPHANQGTPLRGSTVTGPPPQGTSNAPPNMQIINTPYTPHVGGVSSPPPQGNTLSPGTPSQGGPSTVGAVPGVGEAALRNRSGSAGPESSGLSTTGVGSQNPGGSPGGAPSNDGGSAAPSNAGGAVGEARYYAPSASYSGNPTVCGRYPYPPRPIIGKRGCQRVRTQ
jgi:hypothetical protein